MTQSIRGAFLIVASVFLVAGCQKKSACVKNGVVVEIAGNHGHAANISPEHVQRGVGGIYAMTGGTHDHAIRISDADMKELREGRSVTTRSTSVNGHVHEIRVACRE